MRTNIKKINEIIGNKQAILLKGDLNPPPPHPPPLFHCVPLANKLNPGIVKRNVRTKLEENRYNIAICTAQIYNIFEKKKNAQNVFWGLELALPHFMDPGLGVTMMVIRMAQYRYVNSLTICQ